MIKRKQNPKLLSPSAIIIHSSKIGVKLLEPRLVIWTDFWPIRNFILMSMSRTRVGCRIVPVTCSVLGTRSLGKFSTRALGSTSDAEAVNEGVNSVILFCAATSQWL